MSVIDWFATTALLRGVDTDANALPSCTRMSKDRGLFLIEHRDLLTM